VPKGIRGSRNSEDTQGAQGNQGTLRTLKVPKDKVQAIFTAVRTAFTSRNRIQFFKKGKYMDDKIF
jgi:hypothetical protein